MSLIWSQISDKYLTPHDNFQVLKFQYNAEKKVITVLQVAQDKHSVQLEKSKELAQSTTTPLRGICS